MGRPIGRILVGLESIIPEGGGGRHEEDRAGNDDEKRHDFDRDSLLREEQTTQLSP